MEDRPMNKEESYAERRQLFKNIWEAAMQIDDKDDVLNKPKVIKTLRLSEVDKCPVGKTKKQRIKNLRHVCKKILDFCDKQDADDKFYEQVAAAGQPDYNTMTVDIPNKPTRPAPVKHRARKMMRAKSMVTQKVTAGYVTTSDTKNRFGSPVKIKMSRPTSPLKINKLHKPIKRKKFSNCKPAPWKCPQRMNVADSSKIAAAAGAGAAPPAPGEPAARRKRGANKKRGKKKIMSKTGAGSAIAGKSTSSSKLNSGM